MNMGIRIKFAALAGLAAALVAVSPAGAVTNLIVNGSFETGDFTGFTHSNAPVVYDAVVINYGAALAYPIGAFGEAVPADDSTSVSPDAAGSHGAYFVADDSVNESLSQLTKLYTGHYEIGFSAYLPYNGAANPNNATFSGSIIGVNVANFSAQNTPAGTWLNFSGVANIDQAGYYLTSFVYNSFGNPAKDIVIDRVYVTKTNKAATYEIPPTPTASLPEPATWAMMIFGFGMIGASTRSRKARALTA